MRLRDTPPALCGAGKPFRERAACPAHPLLSAGRSPAAPQRRTSAGGAAAHRLQDPAGAEGVLQLRSLPAAGALSGGHRGQRPVREPPRQGRRCRTRRTTCSAPPTGQTSSTELLQYADHIVFNSPRQLARVRPGSKGGGQERGPAHQPGVLHAGRPRDLRPLRPRQPPGHHPCPVGRRRAGRPGPARSAGRPALPHPVRAGCRRAGPDAGRRGRTVRRPAAPDAVAELWRRTPHHPPRLRPAHAGALHHRDADRSTAYRSIWSPARPGR